MLALELLKHELGGSDEDICHRLRTDFAVMYACGLREYQAPRSQAHFVLPETLCEFRGRIDEALMDDAHRHPSRGRDGSRAWSAPPISSSIPSRVNKAANGSPMPPRCIRLKKTLELIERITQRCSRRATHLRSQAHSLHQELKKVMRGFGRQCRGQGHVFVKLVRQTERQLLALGEPIKALGQQAQQLLAHANDLQDAHRQRLTSDSTVVFWLMIDDLSSRHGRLLLGK